jgi:hypothetical protein
MRSSFAVLVLLTLVGAAPALAQRPAAGSWREEIRRLRAAPVVLPVRDKGGPGPRVAARRSVFALDVAAIAESEPNDSVRTADSAAFGDRATGVVNPAGDVDTWFVDLAAGEFFSVDVDAQSIGSPLDATLVLFAPDGRTVVAANDDFDGSDSRISFRVATSGRYYVALSAFGRIAGSPELTYALNFGKVICGVVGTEQEPNDAPGTATPVAIGDAGTGELCARDDTPVGTGLLGLHGPGGRPSSSTSTPRARLLVDPAIALYASDGTT